MYLLFLVWIIICCSSPINVFCKSLALKHRVSSLGSVRAITWQPVTFMIHSECWYQRRRKACKDMFDESSCRMYTGCTLRVMWQKLWLSVVWRQSQGSQEKSTNLKARKVNSNSTVTEWWQIISYFTEPADMQCFPRINWSCHSLKKTKKLFLHFVEDLLMFCATAQQSTSFHISLHSQSISSSPSLDACRLGLKKQRKHRKSLPWQKETFLIYIEYVE